MRIHGACVLFALSACIAEDTNHIEEALSTRTQHPIVLVHGLLGFDDLFGLVDYFEGIPAALEAGGAEVHVVTASQAARPEVRGEQIIPDLEAILDETGAEQVNLIGHSLGALDARYIAAVRPDLVASVTSIGGPHKGTPLATVLTATAPLGSGMVQLVAELIRMISGSDDPNDAAGALEVLTPEGAAEFNVAYPAAVPADCGEGAPLVDGVHYYSWGSTGRLTNPLDPSDPFLLAASLMIPGPNDGLVGRCSTHLGDVIRDDYYQNHLDQTNLLLGIVGPLGPTPVRLYVEHARRLQLAGL
jgi:triacylglycerol lipase